ncbi:hypothetical protein MKI84_12975 [Ancylobacter sp. A5.8]|uniref:hypothetical protein n=1 Tax=Ancylobacter gelatini TaxID=2919920 RepID=UPI001F4E9B8D|nr:hypothetical protein [Ancylobacter gelatini]MCJ8143830.1 hypothetical protein [Ancylobacter gelatini]
MISREALQKLAEQLAIPVACTVLGAALGASLLAALMDDPVAWANKEGRADWLGFWGAIAGGLMTLMAAALAFGLTRRQVDMQASELQSQHKDQQAQKDTLYALTANALRAIATEADEALIALDATNNGYSAPLEWAHPIRSIESIIGYREMWRLDREFVSGIISIDARIQKYEDQRREAGRWDDKRIDIVPALDLVESIKDEAYKFKKHAHSLVSKPPYDDGLVMRP